MMKSVREPEVDMNVSTLLRQPFFLFLFIAIGHLCCERKTETAYNLAMVEQTCPTLSCNEKKAESVVFREAIISNQVAERWSIVRRQIPARYNLESVFFVDDNIGWVGGMDELFRTRNTGLTWEKIPIPFVKGSVVSHIRFRDRNVGWIIAKSQGDEDRQGIDRSVALFETHDGGISWRLRQQWSSITITDMALSGDSIWISGIRYYPNDELRRLGNCLFRFWPGEGSEDRSKNLESILEATGSGTMGVSLNERAEIFVIVSSGSILASSDFGNSWIEVYKLPSMNNRITGFGADSMFRLWIADGTEGREGIGSRFTVLDNTNGEILAYNTSLPGFYLNTAIGLGSRKYVAIASRSSSEKMNSPLEWAVLINSNLSEVWETILVLPKSRPVASLANVGSTFAVLLIENQLIIMKSQ